MPKVSVKDDDDGKAASQINLTLYLTEAPVITFANRADPDQAALQELPDQGLLCLLMGYSHCESVIVICFVVRSSILVLQSS